MTMMMMMMRLLLVGLTVLAVLVGDRVLANHVGTYRVVCYFTNWSQYRPSPATFQPENIDPSLCTHIVFAFAVLNKRLQLIPHDGTRPRSQFINPNSALSLRRYNFDGIELDGVVQGESTAERSSRHRKLPSRMLRRRGLSQAEFQASITFTHPIRLNWDGHFCCRTFSSGPNNSQLAPIHTVENDETSKGSSCHLRLRAPCLAPLVGAAKILKLFRYESNPRLIYVDGRFGCCHSKELTDISVQLLRIEPLKWSVRKWLHEGMPQDKFVVGLSLYGRCSQLEAAEKPAVGAKLRRGAKACKPGTYTREAGVLAYYEVCQKMQDQAYKIRFDPVQDVPYMSKGDDWISYDNERSLHDKVMYMKERRLGGVMIYTLDFDDFSGKFCEAGPHPLLRAIRTTLEQPDPPLVRDWIGSDPSANSVSARSATAAVVTLVFLTASVFLLA
ncbi:PREDICTED: chitinase-3-like protein 2 [Priapulus caudatus]|uniref:Chitinase-3-like protein 2 n=1 Tax=Priapulus caudatus TaxID=37621 RepID=A0ABM1EI93_PRICU|nr:PREDICTED: chitinase-3-like protein 2 [Priapulus caudatus]